MKIQKEKNSKYGNTVYNDILLRSVNDKIEENENRKT
jgi:hypothetical protein